MRYVAADGKAWTIEHSADWGWVGITDADTWAEDEYHTAETRDGVIALIEKGCAATDPGRDPVR